MFGVSVWGEGGKGLVWSVRLIPGLAHWVKKSDVAMFCILDCSFDLVLQWLWCRLAAGAQVRPLAWEPPYAAKKRKAKCQVTYMK